MMKELIKHAKMMISTGDLSVHLVNLPCQVFGAYCENEDGSYSVFINARHSGHRQQQAFLHEIAHIYFDDLNQERDVNQIEAMRRAEQ